MKPVSIPLFFLSVMLMIIGFVCLFIEIGPTYQDKTTVQQFYPEADIAELPDQQLLVRKPDGSVIYVNAKNEHKVVFQATAAYAPK